MGLFLLIPGWLIAVFLICLIGAAWAFWQALPSLLLAILVAVAVIVVLGTLFARAPKATCAVVAVVSVSVIVYSYLYGPQGRLSKQACIWRATGECTVYDEDYEAHRIPAGSYFAIFEMKNRHSQEPNLFAKSYKCVVQRPDGNSEWFYLGHIPQSDTARETLRVKEKTIWSREEVGRISMYRYEHSTWWDPADYE